MKKQKDMGGSRYGRDYEKYQQGRGFGFKRSGDLSGWSGSQQNAGTE